MAAYSCLAVLVLIIFSAFRAKAQIRTPCTSSAISSFTPCFNYLTGSSGTGSSPSEECCNSLKSLMTDNTDCVCLIVTGNVPVSMPFISANLGISLPQMCKSSVPMQCTASGVPLPAPGPVLFGPTPPPAPQHSHGHAPTGPSIAPAAFAPPPHHHRHPPKGSSIAPAAPAPHHHHHRSHSPKASKAATAASSPSDKSLDIEPASPPKFALGPSANPGIRPVYNPKSAAIRSTSSILPNSLVLMFVGIMAF
ncbi:hypothetical protein CDL12_02487 [Handroanthus impetiginosus]|uniref:Bifunctional inhibitor/plant lipid transfer protein/seed storage helical domain-containing protein n=1 Tax=Handroanthus impetiginosus TaxID=429701 RepID=A0A2G9I4U9_9LAMI|nr:hypothetical protein CDL12_12793 [Handroanthus impetiginosus]PIN24783.1 hypothetical protein CDL12_02487 [Handroanthus impetiginosus]